MAITFPRPIVDNRGISECWFSIVDNVAFSPSSNGNVLNLSQVADPQWAGNFVTGILAVEQQAIWSAWRMSLRGGLKTFTAYDVRRSTPFAYPTAKLSTDISPAWNGLAGVTSIGDSGSLALNSLPDAYQFKVGDRVGLEQAGHYGYYEVMEDVTASGGNAAITVAPFLHTTLFDTGAVCRVFQALCQFMIDQSNWSEQGTVENTALSFKGIQRL